MNKKIAFKSKPFYFKKERDGEKPNTIREVDLKDQRFQELHNRSLGKSGLGVIRIINAATGEWFERKITDVSYFKNWVIISWKHE